MMCGSLTKYVYHCDFDKSLGKGTYGNTFNGNSKDGTKVAVKQIKYKPKPDTTYDKKFICKSLKKLITRDDIKTNQYLLPYIDYDLNKEGTFFIILKYCDLGNLADYYEDNPRLTLSDGIDLMTQCADGIACLHSCQIIHRQIKPQNILLRRQGERDIIQIADYYPASVFESNNLSSQRSSNTRSGRDYNYGDYFKPPEAFDNIGITDKITQNYDIFSLGCLYYAIVRKLDGYCELNPVVDGNSSPIGYQISKQKGPNWKFVLFKETATNEKINGLKKIIDNMMVLYPSDRLSSSNVLHQLKALQQVEPERIENEPKEKDISSNLHKKFHQLLLESGPCEPTCDKILDHVSTLPKDELKTILAKGSIKDFLLEFDDIIWKDDQLQAVENNTEKALDNCDSNKAEFYKFKKKIESDTKIKSFIENTYTSLDGATMFVSTRKENINKVTDHLKAYFSEFTFQCFSPSDPEWLTLTDVLINECIGPGSFMAPDRQLSVLKKKCGNRTRYPLSLEGLKDYGSIGCFARNSSGKIYVLSAKHIVEKEFGYHSDSDLDMVSGFEQEHNVTVQRGIIEEKLHVKAKDFVHLTKGYHGMLGAIKQSNVMVDAALFGPLSKAMLKNHECSEESAKKVIVSKDYDFINKRVKKYGAKSGFRRGIIIQANHEYKIKGQEFTGVFVVTSVNNAGKPEQNGNFATQGDSGSIVFLEDDPDSGSLEGLGIIHMTASNFKYEIDYNLQNVVYCVRLDNCIEALNDNPLYLYLHNFTPNLCLGDQEDEREIVDAPATSLDVDHVTSSCEFCRGKTKQREIVQ